MIPPQLDSYQITPELFILAMTHRSYLNEHPADQSNERLEFLGDAILEYIISEEIYLRYPDQPEGILTALRSNLVQTQSLSQIARKLELGGFMRLAKGEEQAGGRDNSSLLENVFEAIIGAIYLSSGINNTKNFIADHLFPQIEKISLSQLKDAKSEFQEQIQALDLPTPNYQVLEEAGPDHDKTFTVGVFVNGAMWGQGTGRSKQQAQQQAAQQALTKLPTLA